MKIEGNKEKNVLIYY